MSEPFIGEIKIFAGNFAIRNWAFCDGQLLLIAQNTALFSILGTTYGGDGRTTFGLPNLRARVPLHPGRGPGLSPRNLGQQGGAPTAAFTAAQMPPHTHVVSAAKLRATSNTANTANPRVNSLAAAEVYDTGGADVDMNADSLRNQSQSAGGGQAHTNMPPYLVMNFIIALQGIYPSRS